MKAVFRPCPIIALFGGLALYAQPIITLQRGTPLRLGLDRSISSAEVRTGAGVEFALLDDVGVSGTVLIRRGTLVLATVTQASRPTANEKDGTLRLKFTDVQLVNGLRAPIGVSAAGAPAAPPTLAVTAGMIVTPIAAPGVSSLFVSAPSRDASIARGTQVIAYVQRNVYLNVEKLSKPASNSPAPSLSSTPLTNEDVVALKRAGLSDAQLIVRIKSAPGLYRLEAADLAALKKAGLSQDVIQAMIDVGSPR
jgi:hypothetical protein